MYLGWVFLFVLLVMASLSECLDHLDLLFVRHGESAANADPECRFERGYVDEYVRLSPKGQIQAIKLGESLPKQDVQFWSSPMHRAIETTSLLIQNTETLSFIVDKRLKELQWPCFENEASRLGHKNEMKKVGMLTYTNSNLGTFECGRDVVRRLQEFLLDHLDKLNKQSNIIVCHEIVMRAFYYMITGDPADFESKKFDNCETLHWKGDVANLWW